MANSVANSTPDVQKRRTSRIEQAVPMTVLGVDALGRPFQERTSTMVVNCHGCRYQSKHYVLKNMWVTLEVPHPETGHEPRSVRGRVMWIQRPRTVREMFQVGVELEAGGNLWASRFLRRIGLRFPDLQPAIPSVPGPANMEAQSGEAFGVLPIPTIPNPERESQHKEFEERHEWEAAPPAEEKETNLRTMPSGAANATAPGSASGQLGAGGLPSAGADASLVLARQMMRLVNEAKQQLQTAARESAAQAVTAEARPLIAALHEQLQQAAKESVASATEHAVQGVLDQTQQASETQLQQLREHWNNALSQSVEQAGQSLSARINEVEEERRMAFLREIEAETQRAVENLHRVTQEFQGKLGEAQSGVQQVAQQAEQAAAPVIQDIEYRLRSYSDQARTQFDDFERAARQWNEQMMAATSSAQSNWQARLEADLDAAESRWNERIENSLESATLQAAAALAHRSQETAEQITRETGSRIVALGQAMTSATDEVEHKFAALRDSLEAQTSRTQAVLEQVEAAARNVEEKYRQFEFLDQTTLQELERRGSSLLDAQSQELTTRGEMALSAWTERLQPAMEEAGRQTVERLAAQLETEFGSQLERASNLIGKLEAESQSVNEALRRHEEELGKISEISIQAAIGRMQGAIGRLEHDLEESGRSVTAKWVSEIDAKATETTHSTFESLFKTAEWYEKKVHTQMQSTLEKGMEQTHEELRKKAGEISGMFAAELDHYSRSYVEHTQGQIEETGRATIETLGQQAADVTATSLSAIQQQAQNQTEAALNRFHDQAGTTLKQTASQLDSVAARARDKFDIDTQRAQAEFRAALALEAQQAVAKSRQELVAQAELAKTDMRIEGARQQTQLRQTLSQVGDQFIESYKKRLENASNSWLLTTVSRLNEQSTLQLDELARSADARLRESCGQVFASIGETLRQRLADVVAPAVISATQRATDEPIEEHTPEQNQR